MATSRPLLANDPVEIVNHNATGRQYAVAGTADALAALEQRLGKRTVRVLPGIDVPFHSSVLAPAVEAFREHLQAVELDAERLVGRWVPNLTGRPFTRDDDAVDLLARQLASPVRWIDVQHALRGRRLIEVAPPHADVLTGLARITLGEGAELLHSERDRDVVLDRDIEEEEDCERRCPPRWRCPPGRTRPLAPKVHPIGPWMPGMRWNSCSRCRRACVSTSSTRRRRSTSSSRACRRVATRS